MATQTPSLRRVEWATLTDVEWLDEQTVGRDTPYYEHEISSARHSLSSEQNPSPRGRDGGHMIAAMHFDGPSGNFAVPTCLVSDSTGPFPELHLVGGGSFDPTAIPSVLGPMQLQARLLEPVTREEHIAIRCSWGHNHHQLWWNVRPSDLVPLLGLALTHPAPGAILEVGHPIELSLNLTGRTDRAQPIEWGHSRLFRPDAEALWSDLEVPRYARSVPAQTVVPYCSAARRADRSIAYGFRIHAYGLDPYDERVPGDHVWLDVLCR